MDLNYWEKYYDGFGPTEEPSDFAKFYLGKYSDEMGLIFDVGCGNGRDTFFFGSSSIPSVGIDQCSIAINKNNQKKQHVKFEVRFLSTDFSNCNYDSIAKNKNFSIYSRFTLHAINYNEEEKFFESIQTCKNLRYLVIEARSVNDSLYGKGKKVGKHEFITSHYRRFIDPETLTCQLQENFEIEYFVESVGFAKTETEDPCLIRVIARKR